MADERPPIEGGDASGFEAAAKAQLAKAKETRTKARGAATVTREELGELDAAERQLGELEQLAQDVERRRKKLSVKQRDVFDRLAAAERGGRPTNLGGGRGGGVTQTQTSLEHRGLIEWQQGKGNQGGYVLTQEGRGYDSTSSQTAVAAQRRQIEQLRQQATRDVKAAADADVRDAKATASDARQAKQRATRKPSRAKVPALRELSAAERDLMTRYIGAQQNIGAGSTDEERAALKAMRDQLRSAGVLGAQPTIGNYGQIPRATTPTLGTAAWQNAMEKAQKSPGFQFTPDPARLAREMARTAGGVDYFPDELSAIAKESTQEAKGKAQTRQQEIIRTLRPHAEQALEQLPPDARRRIDTAVEKLRQAQASGAGWQALNQAENGLLNAAQQAKQVAQTAETRPKVTYASPAVEREIKAENARRAAAQPAEPARPTFERDERVFYKEPGGERRLGYFRGSDPAGATVNDYDRGRDVRLHIDDIEKLTDAERAELDQYGDIQGRKVQIAKQTGQAIKAEQASAATPEPALRPVERAVEQTAPVAKETTQAVEQLNRSLRNLSDVARRQEKGLLEGRNADATERTVQGHRAKIESSLAELDAAGQDTAAQRERYDRIQERLATRPEPPTPVPARGKEAYRTPLERQGGLDPMTDAQRAARARRLEREAKIAEHRAAQVDERLPEGDIDEFERTARQHADRMAAALDPEGKRKLAERTAPVTDPAAQERAVRELDAAKAAAPPPPPPPPPPPAPPAGPPEPPEDRRPLYQRLADAMSRRAAEQEAMAKGAEQEKFDTQVARQKAKLANDRLVRAEARRQLEAEATAARVGPEHEEAQQRVDQARLERRLTNARQRSVQAAERAAQQEAATTAATTTGLHQRLADALAQRQGQMEAEAQQTTGLRQRLVDTLAQRQAQMEAARTPAQARIEDSRAGAPGYVLDQPLGPAKPTRRERSAADRDRRQAEAATRVADAEAERHAQLVAEVSRYEQTYTQRVSESEGELRRWAAQLGVVDQSMRRHGTFTTEFISAAAKGEVAYREWGWQIGAAAAKFGAWTAAGAGIYAAMAAVSGIGQGAIQSASGVDSLKRSLADVNSGQAQASFRDQASHFNVPIETVVDAQTRMGAVFHDQADAATAATAALYALQTGQVDVQQSTKDLIAIQQAYGSSAQDLVGLFDELNYVQNNYGARIPDIETGLASAAGSFKQMGGSMEDAVALFTTLQRFGTTGNITSTILRRMPNELAKPTNQAALRGYGVDPGADVMTIIRQAQKAVRGGADAQEVSKALVGGQWAARFQNLLTHPEFMDKVLGELQGGKATGASEKELGHVKNEATQAIKSIGIELQALGSNLAELGFGTVLGTGVKALSEVLHLLNTIFGLMNNMWAPVKTGVAYLLTGMAALAGARRLGLGGALEGTRAAAAAPYLVETDARRTRRLVGQSLTRATDYTRDDQERRTSEAFRAVAESERMQVTEGRVNKDVDAQLAAGTIDEKTALERRAAAGRAAEAAAQKSAVATERANLSIEQALAARTQQAEFDTLMAATARRDRDAVAARWAAEQGVFIRPSLSADVPASEKVARVGEQVSTGGVIVPGGTGAARQIEQASVEAAAAGAALAGASAPTERARRALPQVRQAMSGMAANLRAVRSPAQAVAAASEAGAVAARGAVIGVTAVGTGLRGLFLGLNAMMGPIGWAIAGLTMLPTIIGAVKAQNRKTRDALRIPTDLPDTKAGLDSFNKSAQKQIDDSKSLTGSFWDTLKDAGNPSNWPGMFLGIGKDPAQERRKGLQAQQDAAKKQYEQVRKARAHGLPASGLTNQQILDQSQQDVADYQRGKIDLAELRKREDDRLKEVLLRNPKAKKESDESLKQRVLDAFKLADQAIEESIDARYNLLESMTDDPIERAQLELRAAEEKLKTAQGSQAKDQDAIDNAQADVNNAKRAVTDALKQKAQQQLDALGAVANAGLGGARALREYVQQVRAEIARLSGSTDPADMQRLASLQGQLRSTLENAGQQQLQDALAVANTPEEIKTAYDKYSKTFETAAGALRAKTSKPTARERDLQRQLQAELAQQSAEQGNPDRQPSAASTTADRARQKRINQLNQEIRQERANRRGGNNALAAMVKALERQRDLQEYQGLSEFMDARTAVSAGRADAGMPRLQMQLKEIGEKVKLALKLHLRGTKEFMQLIVEQQQAEQAIVQEQGSLIQAETAYQAAGEGSNQAAAGADNIAGLQRLLAHQQKHPETYSRSDIVGTMTQIREARTQQAETIRQQASDLMDAQYALRESLNDDPVYQARLEAQRTAAIVRRGGFSSPADRIRAQADANNAKRAAQDAAVQAQVDDIDFDVEIGKKTTEQQIAAYERLLHTAKMGQTQKKELQRQIARLKHEAETGSEDFSLDVGNIRLPSVYEVHRAIKEGRSSHQTVVHNSPTVNVNLAPGDDGSTVVRTLDRYLGTSARSAMRASADIGV